MQAVSDWVDRIERAVEKREVLTLDYRDEAGRPSARDVRPLGLWFWGKVWTLVAWCEMRADFRAFRIDRIAELARDMPVIVNVYVLVWLMRPAPRWCERGRRSPRR